MPEGTPQVVYAGPDGQPLLTYAGLLTQGRGSSKGESAARRQTVARHLLYPLTLNRSKALCGGFFGSFLGLW